MTGGLPGFDHRARRPPCQEAKERVKSAVRAAERQWPGQRIVVNLAPAGLKKGKAPASISPSPWPSWPRPDSSRPIASPITPRSGAALDGRVRPVRGALAVAEGAARGTRARALRRRVRGRGRSGRDRTGSVRHLAEAVAYLCSEQELIAPRR